MATASPQRIDDLPAVGTTLAQKYEVVRLLGRGGMGAVLEARHLKLGENVALKLLLPHLREQADVTRRFEREARAAARLKGVHVARVLDVDVLADGSPFMVMELLRGHDLERELDRRTQLPVAEAVTYVLEACAAMAEAHRHGIVHRDLKPSNLFLAEQDGGRIVKVLDFGISKVAGDINAQMTTTASAFGTPLYMSPEQVRSVKDVDHRTDIWSLGVILYETLAGRAPFEHESATAILAAVVADTPTRVDALRPDVPKALAAAVMKALAKDPVVRFANVRAFADAIAPFASNVPQSLKRGAGGDPLVTRPPAGFDRDSEDAASMATTNISDLSSPAFMAAARRRSLAIVVVSAVTTIALGTVLAVSLVARGSSAPPAPTAVAAAPEKPEASGPVPSASAEPPVAGTGPAPTADRGPEVTPGAPAGSGRKKPPAGARTTTTATPGPPPAPPPVKPPPAVTTDPKYL